MASKLQTAGIASRPQTAGMASRLRYPDRVVIVTGGTKGIGLAIVREFVHEGASVVFASRGSEGKGQAIQRELQASGGPGDAYFQVCDVRQESDIKRLIEVTVERYGGLDCLVNNAGVAVDETIDDMFAQDFRNTIEINTVSSFLASKYALPHLRKRKGNIINMASIAGVVGLKHRVSYVSSKGALIAMTKALAIDEAKYGVRVNSISPSYIWTPLLNKEVDQALDPEVKMKQLKDSQLMGRMGEPKEVALAALFLAAEGTFCTGLNLLVSGGAEVGFGEKSERDEEEGDPESEPSKDGNSQGSSTKQ